MSDAGRELIELKREVVESRNQAIKTDNQVKNLGIDMKNVEKRFEQLERRIRFASLSAHAIVALIIFGAAFIVHSARTKHYQVQISDLTERAEKGDTLAGEARAKMERLATEAEQAKAKRAKGQKVLMQIVAHLDANNDEAAARLLTDVDDEILTPLERKVVNSRLDTLRTRVAETTYRAAKGHLNARRHDNAIKALEKVVRVDPKGPLANKARFFHATTLYEMQRYGEAEPLYRVLSQSMTDREGKDDVTFRLGATLARLGKRDEAKQIFAVVKTMPRYSNSARLYLNALETGAPLPGETVAVRKKRPQAPAPAANVPRGPEP